MTFVFLILLILGPLLAVITGIIAFIKIKRNARLKGKIYALIGIIETIAVITIILFLAFYPPKYYREHIPSEKGTCSYLWSIEHAQRCYKQEVIEDLNNNGIGEYADSFASLLDAQAKGEIYWTANRYVRKSPDKFNGYYFKIYTSSDINEREKHFEVHAWPIEVKEWTKQTLVIDETGEVRAKDVGGKDIPMGGAKDWSEFTVDHERLYYLDTVK